MIGIALVLITGTIAALILGFENAWPFILLLGVWLVGGAAALSFLVWRPRYRRRR